MALSADPYWAGPISATQLAFAGTVSLVLYAVFVFVQAARHRDYFLPDPKSGVAMDEELQNVLHRYPNL